MMPRLYQWVQISHASHNKSYTSCSIQAPTRLWRRIMASVAETTASLRLMGLYLLGGETECVCVVVVVRARVRAYTRAFVRARGLLCNVLAHA